MSCITVIMYGWLLLIESIKCEVQGVTSYNASTESEIYHVSMNDYFSSDSIVCGSKICHIICDIPSGCNNATIDASSSEQLILKCINDNSCQDVIISKYPQKYANIQCNGKSSCYGTTFNLTNTWTINLNCSYFASSSSYGSCLFSTLNAKTANNVNIDCAQYSCQSANFHVNNVSNSVYFNFNYWAARRTNIYAGYIGNKLTINCNEGYSCYQTNIYCPHKSLCNISCGINEPYACSYTQVYIANDEFYNLSLECDDSNLLSCSNAIIECIDSGLNTELNYIDSRWQCTSTDCCSIDGPMIGSYVCPLGSDCIIDCSQQNCTHWILDGSSANSLTVNCSSTTGTGYSCEWTQIKCPTHQNSTSCTTICQEDYSCLHASIQAANLDVSCIGYGSCYGINFDLLSSETVNIACNGPLSCSDSTINASLVDELMLLCTTNHSCKDITISTPPSILADIQCQGKSSCYDANFNLADTWTVNLNCSYYASTDTNFLSDGACYHISLNAETAINVNVTCAHYSCHRATFRVDNVTNSAQFNFNYYAAYLSRIYGDYIENKLMVNCNEGYSCRLTEIYCPYQSSCNVSCAVGVSNACKHVEIYIANNKYNELTFICDDSNSLSCESALIGCIDTDLSTKLDFINSQWECTSNGCCPWEIIDSFVCPFGEDCIIDCSQQDCAHWILDASSATSLTINCSSGSGYGCLWAHIKCGNLTSLCSVICQEDYSCLYTIIDADLSYELILQCINDNSCQDMMVLNSPSMSAVIECQGLSSCFNADFNLTNTATVNLNCSFPAATSSDGACYRLTLNAETSNDVDVYCAEYSCWFANFHVDNVTNIAQFNFDANNNEANIYGYYIGNELIVNCNESYSCRYTDIYCPYQSSCNVLCGIDKSFACDGTRIRIKNSTYPSNLNLGCDDSNAVSCKNAVIYCESIPGSTSLSYITSINRWECTSDTCCPWQIIASYICSPDSDCIIDCSQTNCNHLLLDGAFANSLTVNCSSITGSGYGCLWSHIKCPYKNMSACQIICGEYFACNYATIETMNVVMTDLIIDCSGGLACKLSIIILDFISVDSLILNVGDYGYDDTSISFGNTINYIDVFNILCIGTRSCYQLPAVSISNIDITNFFLHCNGHFSCYQIDFSLSILESVNISCTYQDACYRASIDLISLTNNVITSINCNNSAVSVVSSDSACYMALFTTHSIETNSNWSNQSLAVSCGKYDCYQTTFNLTNLVQTRINCNGKYTCEAINVYSTETESLELHCNNILSCYRANIYCPYYTKDSCNIKCNDYYQSCMDLKIYVDDWFTDDFLDLYCPTTSITACDGLTFKCTADDGYSDKLSTYLYFNDIHNRYESNQCTTLNDTYCCPIIYTTIPTPTPTTTPTSQPTYNPTIDPTIEPTSNPTTHPTTNPTIDSTIEPTSNPTIHPTTHPTTNPLPAPISNPTGVPTSNPTINSTINPTIEPTTDPSTDPLPAPTSNPASTSIPLSDWKTGGQASKHLYAGQSIQTACGYLNVADYLSTHTSTFPYGYVSAVGSVAVGSSFDNLFNHGTGCGACYEIECVGEWANNINCACNSGKTVIVQSIDWSGEYSEPHFDISVEGFDVIAGSQCGQIAINYRQVLCEFTNNIYITTDHNDAWSYYLNFYNVAGDGRLCKVELQSAAKSGWMNCQNMQSKWKCDDSSLEPTALPISFRLTDCSGNVITANNVVNSYGIISVDLGVNFPYTSTGNTTNITTTSFSNTSATNTAATTSSGSTTSDPTTASQTTSTTTRPVTTTLNTFSTSSTTATTTRSVTTTSTITATTTTSTSTTTPITTTSNAFSTSSATTTTTRADTITSSITATRSTSTSTTSGTSTNMQTTMSPTFVDFNLHFVCRYNDESMAYYSIYITLSKYAEIMKNAIIITMQSITHHSTNYNDGDIWQYAEWNRAGILNFDICSVFNNIQLTDDCPLYDESVYSAYTAIATFGIIVDQSLNEYKQYLTEQIISDKFKNVFSENMNDGLNTERNLYQQKRRNLLENEDVNFEAVSVQIIDPLNVTTTQYDDSDNSNKTIIILIVFVFCVLCLIAIIAIIIYLKKLKNKKEEKDTNQEEGKINDQIEMNQNKQKYEGNLNGITGNNDDNIDDIDDIDDNMNNNVIDKRNDDDLVKEINEINVTHSKLINDDDVVEIVNKTSINNQEGEGLNEKNNDDNFCE